jgi:hypothetical protein
VPCAISVTHPHLTNRDFPGTFASPPTRPSMDRLRRENQAFNELNAATEAGKATAA